MSDYRFRVSVDDLKPGYILMQEVSDIDTRGHHVEWLLAGHVFKPIALPVIIRRLKELNCYSVEVKHESVPGKLSGTLGISNRNVRTNINKDDTYKQKAEKLKSTLKHQTEEIFDELRNKTYVLIYNINLSSYEEVVDSLFDDSSFNHYLEVFVNYSENNDVVIQHALNVFYYSLLICSSKESKKRLVWKDLAACALLHDVGYFKNNEKPYWTNDVSFKNDDRYSLHDIKQHVDIGKERLNEHIDHRLLDYIVKHHSYLDGSGYPRIDSQHIPYITRILSAADIFDIHQQQLHRVIRNEKKMDRYIDYVTNELSKKITMEYYRKILALI